MTEDFALVWKRICDNQGNKFLTIRKESFEYKIEDECFIPLRPNKTPARDGFRLRHLKSIYSDSYMKKNLTNQNRMHYSFVKV